MNKKIDVNDYIEKEFLDKDGYYTVNVNLYKDFSLYNKLSIGKQLELNSEIFKYIDIKSEVIPNNYKLRIKFIGRKLNKDDKNMVEYLIREHYFVIKEEVRRELNQITLKMYIMLLLGILLLSLYFLVISKLNFDSLFLELFSILGTFSIWESFGLFIFDRREMINKYYGCLQNFEQVIVFDD